MRQTRHTAGELADRFGLSLRGDAGAVVNGVATLANAGPDSLGFLANPKYRPQLATTRAGVVVMRAPVAEGHAGAVRLAADPYAAFARISALFEPVAEWPAGIHATAAVDASASVAPSAHVAAHVAIGAR